VTHSPHTTRTASALVALLTLAVAGLVALSLSGSAAAATPCGRKILADWYDNGRIDKLYPLHCYEEAVDMIPKDIEDYVDARDVIERALQAAVGGHLALGGKDPTPGDGNGKNGGRGIDGGSPGGTNGSDGGTGPGGGSAASSVDTSSPSSVPIPLVVLGGMSLALLAAGGLGYYSRRRAQADDTGGDTPDDDQLG
jgi:uncharacterized membrane protein YgcG